jgi:hypothetical protein
VKKRGVCGSSVRVGMWSSPFAIDTISAAGGSFDSESIHIGVCRPLSTSTIARIAEYVIDLFASWREGFHAFDGMHAIRMFEQSSRRRT